MDKTEISRIVAHKTAISQKDVHRVVTETIATITDALVRGEKVVFAGFGSFSLRHYPAQSFKKPKTGERYTKAPRSIPRFSPAPKLKARVTKQQAEAQPLDQGEA